MKTLICGSMAYDTIMVFGDRFKNHILPEQIHILNVAFLVPDMRREFGGCAGNIAYSLKLLGDEPLIMATVGDDSAPYMHRLKQLGLDASHVRDVPGSFTAQAFITTDLDDNQITAFHPGAMTHSQLNKVTTPAASASASFRPTAATACCNMRASSGTLEFPSSSIPARACRCSTARNSWPS
jgi:adenosine kinase